MYLYLFLCVCDVCDLVYLCGLSSNMGVEDVCRPSIGIFGFSLPSLPSVRISIPSPLLVGCGCCNLVVCFGWATLCSQEVHLRCMLSPVSMLHVPMLCLHTQSRSHAVPAYSVPFPCCACILSPVPMLCLRTQSCSHATCMPAYSVPFPCYMYACILSPVPMLHVCLHTQSCSHAICILSPVSIFNAACTHTHTHTHITT